MALKYLLPGPLLRKMAGFWIQSLVILLPNLIIDRQRGIPESLAFTDLTALRQEAAILWVSSFSWTWLCVRKWWGDGEVTALPSSSPVESRDYVFVRLIPFVYVILA